MSTVVALAIYAAVQQNYRLTANDPQIEVAQTIADEVKGGIPAESIIGQTGTIDMSASLSLFAMVFDKDGKLLGTSGILGDQQPTPPQGAIDMARNKGENRFTWEPQKGVRVAAVIQKFDGDAGFVLVAKSLKEIEKREKELLLIVEIAWAAMVFLSMLLSYFIGLKLQEAKEIAITKAEVIAEEIKHEEHKTEIKS
jgi:hypothetical protein